jgi:hypothetical protein
MKGKKGKKGYTDEWLVDNGCEPGSTLEMTESAFMTNDAWIEISKKARVLRVLVLFQFYCSQSSIHKPDCSRI